MMITVGRKIVYVNDHMCDATGYTKEELVGHCTFKIYDSKETYIMVGELIRLYKSFTKKVNIKKKNGIIKQYFLKFTKAEDENYVTIYLDGE